MDYILFGICDLAVVILEKLKSVNQSRQPQIHGMVIWLACILSRLK